MRRSMSMPGEVMEEKVGLGEWAPERIENLTFQKVIVLTTSETSFEFSGSATQVGDWWHVWDLTVF